MATKLVMSAASCLGLRLRRCGRLRSAHSDSQVGVGWWPDSATRATTEHSCERLSRCVGRNSLHGHEVVWELSVCDPAEVDPLRCWWWWLSERGAMGAPPSWTGWPLRRLTGSGWGRCDEHGRRVLALLLA